ncbi:hypothetical protein HY989_04005 [Candidatus Micrarchaeota archaeon]|nr:hypothetical protein [Candidatus Micrarchaeota archaeon]
MANRTFHIADELDLKMKKHSDIRWGEVARNSFEEKIALLEFMDKALSKSTLTDSDAIRMGREINKSMAKRILQWRALRK